MSFLGTGFGGASSSYSITNSARFDGTSDYLSKTLTTSATTSGAVWVKRSKLGAVSPIFDNKVYFTSGDALYAFGLTSTALYRDPSAWYHIFWNGTGVYVNGTLVTGSGTYTAASVTNPRLGYDGTNYFSGYLSDFAFWNGSSASLQGGATDANGVWAAKRPSAGYSFLAFGSSGALGTDTSGNGNNWTVSGSPVQTVDTPTNNHSVFNSLYLGLAGTCTSSEGNLRVTNTNSVGNSIPLTFSGNGKHYVEFKLNTCGNDTHYVGLADANWPYWGGADKQIGYYANGSLGVRTRGAGSSPQIYRNSTTAVNTTTGINANDYFCLAWDNTTGNAWIGSIISGTRRWYDSAGTERTTDEPGLGTNVTYTFSGHSLLMPGITPRNFSSVDGDISVIVQESSLQAALPSGFNALCTANLTSTAVTTSGTFTGNANADGPFVWTNGNPATLTINGNAVTFGTHADKTAGGFKLRSSSASYNTSGSNTWTATAGNRFVYSATSINTAQGNP